MQSQPHHLLAPRESGKMGLDALSASVPPQDLVCMVLCTSWGSSGCSSVSCGMSRAGHGSYHTGSAYFVSVSWLLSSVPSLHLSEAWILSHSHLDSAPSPGEVWSGLTASVRAAQACSLGPPAWLSLLCLRHLRLLSLLYHRLWTCLSPALNAQVSLLSCRLSDHMKGRGRAGGNSCSVLLAPSLPFLL